MCAYLNFCFLRTRNGYYWFPSIRIVVHSGRLIKTLLINIEKLFKKKILNIYKHIGKFITN